MKPANPDLLPKGTVHELRRLRMRLLDLGRAKVYVSPLSLKALERTIQWVAAHPVERT